MKAAVVYSPFGAEKLKIEEIEEPELKGKSENQIIVKIDKAGLNPVDFSVIHGKIVYNLSPVPHIPGSEAIGTALTDGKNIKKGDKVMIYNRVFCGSCEYCLSNNEHLCINGGIWGVVSNGGYTEKVAIPEHNLFKIPEGIDDNVAVSTPIGALTSYRSLLRAGAEAGKKLLIYGASGNTGIFAAQLGHIMGLEVYAVSRKDWMKDYGAKEVFRAEKIPEDFKADIVMNSLGSTFWESSMKHIKPTGSLVTFGVLTGREAGIDIANIYTREISIVGSTGGTRKELQSLLNIMKIHEMKAPVAKTFKLENIKDAIEYFKETRDGRIIIEP